jgi:hypothetical protein
MLAKQLPAAAIDWQGWCAALAESAVAVYPCQGCRGWLMKL